MLQVHKMKCKAQTGHLKYNIQVEILAVIFSIKDLVSAQVYHNMGFKLN